MIFFPYKNQNRCGSLHPPKIELTTSCVSSNNLKISRERISLYASQKGSLTLEAALVFPLLLFLAAAFLNCMALFRLSMDLGQTAADAARELGQYAYLQEAGQPLPASDVLSQAYVYGKIQLQGIRDNNEALLKYGRLFIRTGDSRILEQDGVVDLRIAYEAELPLKLFGRSVLPMKNRQVCRAWIGYDRDQDSFSEKEGYVYVTVHGEVYHNQISCSYLQLRISETDYGSVGEQRNLYGERYQKCRSCKGEGSVVYITDTGNRYHGSLSCTGLKRSIRMIPVSQVEERRACSRCGT